MKYEKIIAGCVFSDFASIAKTMRTALAILIVFGWLSDTILLRQPQIWGNSENPETLLDLLRLKETAIVPIFKNSATNCRESNEPGRGYCFPPGNGGSRTESYQQARAGGIIFI
jgi:hypothetical protein